MLTTFEQVIAATRQEPVRTVAVAVAEKESVLESERDAVATNMARPLQFS